MHGLGKTEAQLTSLEGGTITRRHPWSAAGQVLLPGSALFSLIPPQSLVPTRPQLPLRGSCSYPGKGGLVHMPGLDKRSPRWRTKEAFSLPPALSTQPHCCSSKKKLKQPMKLVKEQQCAEAIPPDSTMGRRAERASIPRDWLYSNACRSL